MTASERYTLCVETGPHAGAVQRLAPGLYTAGAATPATLVLQDDGLAPLHVLLELGEDEIRIEALNGEVAIEGVRRPLSQGQEYSTPAPVALTIGSTRISLRAPVPAGRRGLGTAGKLALAGGGVLAGLVLLAVLIGQIGQELALDPLAAGSTGAQAETEAPAIPSAEREVAEAAPAVMPEAAADPQPAPAPEGAMAATSAEAAKAALEARLAEAGLTLEPAPDDASLVLRGRIDAAKLPDWRAVQSWYDAAFGAAVPLVAQIEVDRPADVPKLMIQSVWTGERPYLIAGNGERYAIGATIAGGWTIDAIEPDRIVLRRGPSRFELTL
jgi:hypothetical protein